MILSTEMRRNEDRPSTEITAKSLSILKHNSEKNRVKAKPVQKVNSFKKRNDVDVQSLTNSISTI